jgi:pilus assembly protein Flp/PilA
MRLAARDHAVRTASPPCPGSADNIIFELEAHSMKKLVNGFHRNEEGAALAEYGLLVALIAVVCVVAVTALGTQISTAFSQIASALAGA